MKITDFENEDAIDLLADILEPATKIIGDKEVANAVKANRPKLEVVKVAMRKHKSEIVEILARCNGVAVKDYKCNVITITKDLLELLSDEELVSFFQSQGQMMANESSGSAMVSTEASKQ